MFLKFKHLSPFWYLIVVFYSNGLESLRFKNSSCKYQRAVKENGKHEINEKRFIRYKQNSNHKRAVYIKSLLKKKPLILAKIHNSLCEDILVKKSIDPNSLLVFMRGQNCLILDWTSEFTSFSLEPEIVTCMKYHRLHGTRKLVYKFSNSFQIIPLQGINTVEDKNPNLC